MTQLVPKKLAQAAITTGTTTIYTVPTTTPATTTYVKDIDICNTTAASVNVTVYLVPSGDSAGTSNTLIPGVALSALGMMQWTGTQIINQGDTIQVIASATGCTINISGGEQK